MFDHLHSRPAGVLVVIALTMASGCRSDGAGTVARGTRSATAVASPERRDDRTTTSTVAPAKEDLRPRVELPAYVFSYNSRLTIRGQKLIARLSGQLARSARWEHAGRPFQTYQITDPRVTLAAGGDTKTAVAGVDEPFIVTSDAPLEIAFAPAASAGARQLLTGLAAAIQFHLASRPGAETWATEERDVSGLYAARYSKSSDGWFEKRKTHYVGATVPFEVDKSLAKARLSDAGDVVELSFAEELRSQPISLHYQTTVTFNPAPGKGKVVEAAIGRFPDGYARLPIDRAAPQLSDASVQAASPEKPFSEAFKELVSSGHGAFDAPTMLAVTQRLKHNPGEIQEILRALEQKPEQASTLTSLLVAVNHPDARAAVKRVMADPAQPRRVRMELLASLLLQGAVDEELLRLVRSLSSSSDEQMATTAINVEGELIRRASERPTFDVTAPREDYLARARECAPVDKCVAFTAGLGYIASDPALKIVHRHLQSPAVELRVAAIRTLESVKDSRADGWIVSALRSTQDYRVRERAIHACAYRGSGKCITALRGELATAKTPTDRITLLQALGSGRFPRAAVQPVVARTAKLDKDSKVRAFAVRMLEQLNRNTSSEKTRKTAKPD